MPKLTHESLLLLFRNRPQLAAELLRTAFNLPVPAYKKARIASADLSQVTPTEYRADLVILLDGEKSNDGAMSTPSKLAIVVEVQLQRDDDKRWTWPVYLSTLAARHRCSTQLIVVTVDPATAAWCRQPIHVGPGDSHVVRPAVLGPDNIPVVKDLDEARCAPELAVLAVLAHAQNPDLVDIVAGPGIVAGEQIMVLDEEKGRLYTDLVLFALGQAAQGAFERLTMQGYEYQSDFARKYVAQGKAEGEAKGKAEGEAKGKAESVLTILTARKIALSEAVSERVLACIDIVELDRWLVKAVTLTRAEELFQ